MEGDKNLTTQKIKEEGPPPTEPQQSEKRFKDTEGGDGISSGPKHIQESLDTSSLKAKDQSMETLIIPKRASTRELNYIDTNNILPEPDPKEEAEEKLKKEEEILKRTAKKKKRTIEFENKIEDINELSELNIFNQYRRLKKKSSKLDMFIRDKLTTMKESLLQPPTKIKQNLKIKISSTYNEKSNEWNLRIQGRVMQNEQKKALQGDDYKMLNFFEKIFIDFEKEDQTNYLNIDWRKLNNADNCSYDAIDITRSMIPEKESIKISIKFFKEYSPKEFMLSEKLSKLIDIQQGSIITIVYALWQYIKLNRLQDRDNRKIINCNKEMEEVFMRETIDFSKINSILHRHFTPIEPLEVNYEIIKGEQEPTILNIPVEVNSRHRTDLEDIIVANNINLITSGEMDHRADEESLFDKDCLNQEEKSFLSKVGTNLRNKAYAYRFFTEYAENPKLKIQNIILEQKKYLEVMSSKEHDLTFELEKEEDHSHFYQQNMNWIVPEIEDYEYENEIKIKKERELIEATQKENEPKDQEEPQ
ncbi:unnamed protein product [Moneuplotes crassus]|uniref:DM2 domain-containing protein n=2 Tax=Euplotes crassus TaxID=5936 RepID=A0AAD1UH77_EUPCR|nr:unnamed protein product [Moneuplotes crassus]